MVSFTNILFLMGLGFSLAAPLGPVNMEMIKQSLKSKFGFLLGMITGIGAMTGDFIIASVVLFIGDEYLRNVIEITFVFILLATFNVFILGYIGISALKAEPPKREELQGKQKMLNGEEGKVENIPGVLRTGKQYGTGFVIVVTSPWSYFWWTSFGGVLLNSGIPLSSTGERLIATVFFLAGILFWIILLTVSLGVSRKFASPKILNYITKGSALLILLFAIIITYDAFAFIFGFPSLRG